MKNFKDLFESKISVAYVLFGGLFGGLTFLLPIHIMHYHSFIGGIVLFFVLFAIWLFALDKIESNIEWGDEEDEFYED